MTEPGSETAPYRRGLVLGLVLAVGIGFVWVIRDFILALFLAAIFSTLLQPVYHWTLARCRRRRGIASGLVLLGFVVVVGLPLLFFIGLIANEVVQLLRVIVPWIRDHLSDPVGLSGMLPGWLPVGEAIEPYRELLLERLEAASGNIGSSLVQSITTATGSMIAFGITMFVFLYAMYFFLMRGAELFHAGLRYLPLDGQHRDAVVEKGIAVTRATLKSILVIGVIQGVLTGLALWVVGISGAAFWGTVVVVLAAVPALGAPLVWIPAAVWLVVQGDTVSAVGLVAWGIVVIGLVDNILRPRIVGEETRLLDLVVLVSSLGGIAAFGALGIIVGPIIAAVFFVVLDIYRHTFASALPGVRPRD